MMTLYRNRYQADKARKYLGNGYVSVKVYGGYYVMTVRDYRIWKNQK